MEMQEAKNTEREQDAPQNTQRQADCFLAIPEEKKNAERFHQQSEYTDDDHHI